MVKMNQLNHAWFMRIVFQIACIANVQCLPTFEEQCLYAHNYVRRIHLVNDLKWDVDLSENSFKYAQEVAKENTLKHSENADKGVYGENIFKGFSGFKYVKEISEAVYYWYLEIQKHDFSNPAPELHEVGHFTQLVWRTTDLVGCGYATNEIYGGLMTYIVCQYRPGGNLDGFYLMNVLPPKQGAKIPSSPEVLKSPVGCIDIYNNCDIWTNVCRVDVYNSMMNSLCKRTCQFC